MSFFCEECGLEWADRRNQDSVEAAVCHKCIDDYEEEEEAEEELQPTGYRTWGKRVACFNPMTGDIWPKDGGEWHPWTADVVEITYDSP